MALVLLAAYAAMALHASTTRSVVFDEPFHLASGYVYWTDPEHPLAPGNGVLAQAWAALPLFAMDVSFPDLRAAPYRDYTLFGLGYELVYQRGNPFDAMLFASRAMITLAGALLGLLVYLWSRSLWGPVSGLISLALYALCPAALAHGALATTDMLAALGFMSSAWALGRLSHVVSWGRFAVSCAACGVLIATKMSAVLLLPIAVVLIAAQLGSSRPIEVRLGTPRLIFARRARAQCLVAVGVVHALALVALVWTVYDVPHERAPALPAGGTSSVQAWVLDWVGRAGVLPEGLVSGVTGMSFSNDTRTAFAAGERTLHGFWWFFPYALALKTPLGTIAVLLLALGAPLAKRFGGGSARSGGDHDDAGLAPLFALLCVYLAASVGANLNIGHRHVLPLYPALYVLAGASAAWCSCRSLRAAVPLGLALVAVLGASLSVRPYYLAFFNTLGGGPERGYQHLVDSSLDWGQDLPGLARYLRARGDAERRPHYLSYFGTGVPERYGIHARRLPGFHDLVPPTDAPLAAGTYCISATMLQSVYNRFPGRWTQSHEREYQRTRVQLARWDAARGDPTLRAELLAKRSEAQWRALLPKMTELRFARLMAFLRGQPPDAQVGYSILIFELDADELARSLDGPPAELGPEEPGLVPTPRE